MTSDALKKTCKAGYQAMADDARREADAQKWIEALNQDVSEAIDLAVVPKVGDWNSTPLRQ